MADTDHTRDRNLLFGILAVQLDFVTRDQLMTAMNAWILEKARSIESILSEQGALTGEERELLAALIQKHLANHSHDVSQSLASFSSIDSLREELASLDAEIDATLARSYHNRPEPAERDSTAGWSDPGSAHQRYRILRPHARGGLGKVSVAHDQELQREVALKEIQEQRAGDPESRTRFVQEAEITGRLEHPGIVPVYGLGHFADGRPFYAMRFVQGDSLRQAIQRFHQRAPHRLLDDATQAIEFRKLLSRLIDVCEAIEYAHSRGVLHRDLKPGNIMLGKYGETLVVDWGLAKPIGRSGSHEPSEEPTLRPTVSTDTTPTLAGSAVGTPAYMSPEQAAGRLDELGPASDVYSLGATLYSILTGKAPYDHAADPGITLTRVQQGDFPAPRAIQARVPVALEAVCLKAMALRPADRYASPRELADELERWLADEPLRAYAEPLVRRAARWVRKHRTVVTTCATTAGVLLIVALVLATLHWHRLDVARRQVADHVARAHAATTEGDYDRAINEYTQAESLTRNTGGLQQVHDEVADTLQRLQRFRQFDQLVRVSLKEGTHVLREANVEEDPILAAARQALDVYGVTEDPSWQDHLPAELLPESQIVQAKARMADLLNMVALRLAMYDAGDEATRLRTRQALTYFRLAEPFRPPTVGIEMARMLFHRRLEEDEQADAAGDRMAMLAQTTDITAMDAYLLGVMTLKISKKPREAVGMLQQALAMEPNHYGANWSLFQAYQQLGQLEEQIATLSTCLALRPQDANLHYFRGVTHFSRGAYELAELDFEALVKLDPRHRDGQYWRGRAYVMREDWQAASRRFAEALRLDPEFELVYSWQALAMAKLGQVEQVHPFCTRALNGEVSSSIRWRCARAYALAAAHGSDETQHHELAAQAIELLKQLEQQQYFAPQASLASLSSDDMDSLRGHTEFQQLLDRCAEPILGQSELAQSPALKRLRLRMLLDRSQWDAARETAESHYQLAQRVALVDPSKGAYEVFQAACGLAACASALPQAKSAATAEQSMLRQSCENRAIEWLAESLKMGLDDPLLLAKTPDLETLRHLPAFQALLAEAGVRKR